MKQVTSHRRVGDVEHARTELRGQPHEFAQYQFHLDKLHAKRVARERRKEAAKLEEPIPFDIESDHGLFGGSGTIGTHRAHNRNVQAAEAEAALAKLARMEMDELNRYFSGKTTDQVRTVGYGLDANTAAIFRSVVPLTATEMKAASDAMDRHGTPIFRAPWWRDLITRPTVDEMLKADAGAGAYVRGRNDIDAFINETEEKAAKLAEEGVTLTNTPRAGESEEATRARMKQGESKGFYERAAEAVAESMSDACPVMRDGRIIGTVNLRDLQNYTDPALMQRLRRMVAHDDIRRFDRAVNHKPTHGGHPPR